MHTCEVLMRHDLDTPEENLLTCGDGSNKKMGFVWVCDYHYDMFRYSIDAGDTEICRKVMDSTGCNGAFFDTYFELGDEN